MCTRSKRQWMTAGGTLHVGPGARGREEGGDLFFRVPSHKGLLSSSVPRLPSGSKVEFKDATSSSRSTVSACPQTQMYGAHRFSLLGLAKSQSPSRSPKPQALHPKPQTLNRSSAAGSQGWLSSSAPSCKV